VTAEELVVGRQLVEELTGVLLEPHDLPAFGGAVEDGMRRAGLQRPEEYFARLRSGGAGPEHEYLLDQVVNNETYFFREPQHFGALSGLLRDEHDHVGGARNRVVRVLSAGCSTGEEPYSLAMELLELAERLPGLEFEVVAVDISHGALDRARKAVYGSNSFRNGLARTRQQTWFEAVGDGAHRVAARVTDKVEFRSLNLHADHALRETLGMMDVIFFRNVLIYLSPAARVRICRSLLSVLRESGCLFVGTSESLPLELDGLVSQQVDGAFYWRKEPAGRGEPRAGKPPGRSTQRRRPPVSERRRESVSAPAPRVDTSVVTPSPGGPDTDGPVIEPPDPEAAATEVDAWFEEAGERAAQDRSAEALDLLGKILERAPDHVGACRLMAELCLDRADFDDALRLTDQVIGTRALLAWPHVLRGRISHYQGDTTAAQRELKKAIYYQPDHWPAHYYLAEVHKGQGEMSLAVHAYRNALRTLRRAGQVEGQDANLIGYSAEDIATTCEMNIRSLSGHGKAAT